MSTHFVLPISLTNFIGLDVKKETSTIIFNPADLKLNDVLLFSNELNIVQNDPFCLSMKRQSIVCFPFDACACWIKGNIVYWLFWRTNATMGYYKSSSEHNGAKK
jgi:aminopeptidase 2